MLQPTLQTTQKVVKNTEKIILPFIEYLIEIIMFKYIRLKAFVLADLKDTKKAAVTKSEIKWSKPNFQPRSGLFYTTWSQTLNCLFTEFVFNSLKNISLWNYLLS